MNPRAGDKAGPLVGTVVEDILAAAGRPGVVGVVGIAGVAVVVVGRLIVAEQVRVGVRRQRGVENKKRAAAVAVVTAVGIVVVAAEVVTGNENENENVNVDVDLDLDVSAAAGVDGGAKNEANMRPSLRLEVGKKSSSRRPGQLGSGQRQTGQNMNKIGSDFGRRPGCGTS